MGLYIALALLALAVLFAVWVGYRVLSLMGARQPSRFSTIPAGENATAVVDSHPYGNGYADPAFPSGKTSLFEDSSTTPIRVVGKD